MSKRFGRNQRRQAREKIARLEWELAVKDQWLTQARYAVATARQEGAADLLRAEYLDEAVEYIYRVLAEGYGPQIAEVAKRVMASERGSSRRRPFDFHAVIDPNEMRVSSIEGFIPSLHYRVQLLDFVEGNAA